MAEESGTHQHQQSILSYHPVQKGRLQLLILSACAPCVQISIFPGLSCQQELNVYVGNS